MLFWPLLLQFSIFNLHALLVYAVVRIVFFYVRRFSGCSLVFAEDGMLVEHHLHETCYEYPAGFQQ